MFSTSDRAARKAMAHIPHKRLLEIAEPSLTETGYVETNSVMTPAESAHFRDCACCIESLAEIVRELVGQRYAKKSAANQ